MDREQEIEILTKLCGFGKSDVDGCVVSQNGKFDMFAPPISTDETASMLVVRAMISRGWSFEASVDEDGAIATFRMITDVGNGSETSVEYLGECESLAESTCLAAKAWIDAQPKG